MIHSWLLFKPYNTLFNHHLFSIFSHFFPSQQHDREKFEEQFVDLSVFEGMKENSSGKAWQSDRVNAKKAALGSKKDMVCGWLSCLFKGILWDCQKKPALDQDFFLRKCISNHETKQASKYQSDPSSICFTIDVWIIKCCKSTFYFLLSSYCLLCTGCIKKMWYIHKRIC